MYIVYDEKTKRVQGVPSEKPFINYTEGCKQAEVTNIPEKYDYLTVTNIQEKTRVVKEAYTEEIFTFNEETGKEITTYVKHPEETETYYTCDLVANFYTFTKEQIEKQKEKRYEALCKKLIAEKIAIEDELKTIRRLLVSISPEVFTDAEARMNFFDYNLDVENCILKASEEVYK